VPETTPKISVIIAAYSPGAGINLVIDSLDAQTLPQSEFETIIIDDGSPDDTYQRLQGFAATRANLRVARIENSGWPSRPRNLATKLARGDYVLYMDHDDSLYPEALARVVAFAAETGADLISPKESKTSEVWWCMPALAAGNAADVKPDDAIGRILPMVPHKVYRREFLLANNITFPEGRRKLWEDVYFNVEAYALAERGVAVLADTPIYLWHASDSNNSGTYGATDTEFWDRLEELMAFIDTTLAGPELAVVRRTMIIHQYQGRVLRRLGSHLQDASPAQIDLAMSRAKAIQDAYVPEEWDSRLGFFAQPRARFLRDRRPDLLLELHRAYDGLQVKTTATSLGWVEGKLHLAADARWHRASQTTLGFVRKGERILAQLPEAVTAALPPEALDVTDRLDRFSLTFGVRARAEYITWQLPGSTLVEVVGLTGDEVTPVAHGTASLDPATAAFGAPLAETVWDLSTVARWDALQKVSAITAKTEPLPALIDGQAAVAYANRKAKLSVDLSQTLHSVILDGGTAAGPVIATPDGFVLQLPKVQVSGSTRVPARLVLDPSKAGAPPLSAELIGDATGARVEVTGRPRPGRYRLVVATATSKITGGQILRVGAEGTMNITLRPVKPTEKRRGLRWLAAAILRRLRRR
jgi:hypothetical protein